jgi:uncharacterized repeat protein (TIGR02543 family)
MQKFVDHSRSKSWLQATLETSADFLSNLISPSKGKRVKRKSPLRAAFAASLVSVAVMANLTAGIAPAQALSVDASQAAFNFSYPSNGTLISGASTTANGAVVKFSNVTGTPIAGISIDAVVTTALSNSTITNYDNIGNASSNTDYFQANTDVSAAYGFATFKFDFYEANSYSGPGTGTPLVLRNVSITSIDLDGSNNYCQYSDFTGFQSYVLSTGSSLNVQTNATNSAVPVGTTRFLATSCQNNSNRAQDAVQVQFDSVTSFTAKVGTDRFSSPNYFGFAFKPMSTLFGITPAPAVQSPSNQPPTSNNTTRYVTTSQPSIIQLSDFGNYQDADSNPLIKVQITALPSAGSLEKFVNGAWVAVALNDEISASDITNGNLRFTGAVDRSLQFKVSDGNSYSTSAYTLSLLVSDFSQVITFANPETKAPTSPTFESGAVSDSGLTVTLTSSTPGVCTVSGTTITPVASGLCTIVATQSGNSTYSAATPVSQTFPISALTPQTISAPNPGPKTFSGTSFTVTLAPTATSNLTVSMISQSPEVCTVSGMVLTIIGPGNCTIRNVQGGNATYAPAPTVEFTFVVGTPTANFTITYDANGANGGSAPADTTGNGNVTLRTNSGSLAQTGYTFEGWNTQADGQGTSYAEGATYNLTVDITLYAEWAAVVAPTNYTITYDPNGADSGSAPADTIGNGNVTLRANSGSPGKGVLDFTGWNTQADGLGFHYEEGDAYNLTADITLYAEWTLVIGPATFTITYDTNGADSGNAPANTTGNGNVTLRTNSGSLAQASYTFEGWNTQADGQGTSYAEGATYNLTVDVTLYAEWAAVVAPTNYTITYHANGADSGTIPASTVGNGLVTLRSNSGTLALAGFTFKGWNTQADGLGTRYAVSYSFTLSADLTLYADWEAITVAPPVKITYNKNGATAGFTPPATTGNGPVATAGNVGGLTLAGMRFVGWNTEPDGSGTRYQEADLANLTGNVTLYAEWEPIYDLADTGDTNRVSIWLLFLAFVSFLGGSALLGRTSRR